MRVPSEMCYMSPCPCIWQIQEDDSDATESDGSDRDGCASLDDTPESSVMVPLNCLSDLAGMQAPVHCDQRTFSSGVSTVCSVSTACTIAAHSAMSVSTSSSLAASSVRTGLSSGLSCLSKSSQDQIHSDLMQREVEDKKSSSRRRSKPKASGKKGKVHACFVWLHCCFCLSVLFHLFVSC